MKFTLTIDCGNAAFVGSDGPLEPDTAFTRDMELARILHVLAGDFESNALGTSGILRDHNGNRVGEWSLTEGA